MTGSAFPIAYRARDVVFRLAPQDTYNYRKLREGQGGARAHPSGGWRIYVGGGFGSQYASKKMKKTVGFIRFSAIFRDLC